MSNFNIKQISDKMKSAFQALLQQATQHGILDSNFEETGSLSFKFSLFPKNSTSFKPGMTFSFDNGDKLSYETHLVSGPKKGEFKFQMMGQL